MLHCCYYEVQTPRPTTTATREKYIFLNNSLLTAHDFVFVAVISESRRISTKVNLFCTGLQRNLFSFSLSLTLGARARARFVKAKVKRSDSHHMDLDTHVDAHTTRRKYTKNMHGFVWHLIDFVYWFERHLTHISPVVKDAQRLTHTEEGGSQLYHSRYFNFQKIYFFAENSYTIDANRKCSRSSHSDLWKSFETTRTNRSRAVNAWTDSNTHANCAIDLELWTTEPRYIFNIQICSYWITSASTQQQQQAAAIIINNLI